MYKMSNVGIIENQYNISNNPIMRIPTNYNTSDVCLAVPRRVQVVLIIDGIYEIPNNSFASCHELKHIILPDTVKIIDK